VNFRPATPDDTTAVLSFYRAMLGEMVRVDGARQVSDQREAWTVGEGVVREALENPAENLIVLLEEGASAVGFLHAIVKDLPAPYVPLRIVCIRALYLNPQHRGGSASRDLLAVAVGWGRACGAREIECSTHNPTLLKFLLEKDGWGVLETTLHRQL